MVRPDGFVGGVRLSERRALAVTTKVPVANLLGLASLAYRSVPLAQAAGVTDLSVDRPLDWLAYLAVLEIESLVAHGVRQGYVEVEQEIPYIRGRIRFGGGTSVRARPGLVPCAYADFRVDTPENQILRATLERLRTMRLPESLRARADEAARALDPVRIVPLSAAHWARVRITRLNQHYGPAIELCRLLDDSLGVEAGDGAVEARAFFFPMARVLEAAVANHLRGCRFRTPSIACITPPVSIRCSAAAATHPTILSLVAGVLSPSPARSPT